MEQFSKPCQKSSLTIWTDLFHEYENLFPVQNKPLVQQKPNGPPVKECILVMNWMKEVVEEAFNGLMLLLRAHFRLFWNLMIVWKIGLPVLDGMSRMKTFLSALYDFGKNYLKNTSPKEFQKIWRFICSKSYFKITLPIPVTISNGVSQSCNVQAVTTDSIYGFWSLNSLLLLRQNWDLSQEIPQNGKQF